MAPLVPLNHWQSLWDDLKPVPDRLLGRVTSYTDADLNTTTTAYDLDGRPRTVADGKGSTVYTYDGTDANGLEEHRGLVTRLDAGMGTAPSVFTAAYDPAGQLAAQNIPGGITATYRYDPLGTNTRISYNAAGWWLPIDSVGEVFNTFQQVVQGGDIGGGRLYSYDPAGRLIRVEETDTARNCHTRVYSFSANSNRTRLDDYPNAVSGDGRCATTTTPVTTSHGYDAADRIWASPRSVETSP